MNARGDELSEKITAHRPMFFGQMFFPLIQRLPVRN